MNKSVGNNVKWMSISSIILSITAIIFRFYLGKKLLPTEFGYLSIVNVIIGIALLTSNLGVGESIIREEFVDDETISSLYWFNFLITLCVSVVILVNLENIENFFNMSNLVQIIKYTPLIFVFQGISSNYNVLLRKFFYFKEISLINIITNVVDIVLKIVLLESGLGLLSIVYGYICSSSLKLILLIYISRRKNIFKLKLIFSFNKIKGLLSFGLIIWFRKIILLSLQRYADQIMIGKFYGEEILGYYSFARNLVYKIYTTIENSYSVVLYSHYSQIKNNSKQLKEYYFSATKMVSIVSFPIIIGFATISPVLIPFIFGEKWNPSVPVVILISVSLLPTILTNCVTTSLLKALGVVKEMLVQDIVISIIYFIMLYICIPYSLVGVACVQIIYGFIKFFRYQFILNKKCNYSIKNIFSEIFRVVLINLTMMLSVYLVMNYFSGLYDIYELGLSIIAGVVTYTLMIFTCFNDLIHEIREKKFAKV